ncbi:MAG: hypothetical protein ACEQSK_12870, partial [Sphingomonadaceae bacterium]
IQADLFSFCRQGFRSIQWGGIISNPPYLSEEDLIKIQPEVRVEPQIALNGGKDGFARPVR